MTKDEIIEMARQVGVSATGNEYWPFFIEELVAFANLVAAKATEEANAKANASWTLMCKKMVAIEREACAKVCEQSEIPIPIDVWLGSTKKEISKHTALALANAIRARGEQA